jgi:hypothetical protein
MSKSCTASPSWLLHGGSATDLLYFHVLIVRHFVSELCIVLRQFKILYLRLGHSFVLFLSLAVFVHNFGSLNIKIFYITHSGMWKILKMLI